MKPADGRCSAAPRSSRAIPIGEIIYYFMSIFMATTEPASGPVTRPDGPVWWQRSSKSLDISMQRAILKVGGLPHLISSKLGSARKPLKNAEKFEVTGSVPRNNGLDLLAGVASDLFRSSSLILQLSLRT